MYLSAWPKEKFSISNPDGVRQFLDYKIEEVHPMSWDSEKYIPKRDQVKTDPEILQSPSVRLLTCYFEIAVLESPCRLSVLATS